MPATLDESKRALEAEITLRLLDDVDGDNLTSQRSLAVRLGIAVGLANAYLKRCVRKGWVKVRQVPARRYAYYLTPQGFAEKSRLTAEYLGYSFAFFRTARAQCVEILETAERAGTRRVLLAGDGDLAEIATLAAREAGVELVAVWAPGCNRASIAGVPVVADLPADGFDMVLLTDIRAPQQSHDDLARRLGQQRILVPRILRVSRRDGASDDRGAGGEPEA
jgi:DNA-binding MarR family transcriptional regulator